MAGDAATSLAADFGAASLPWTKYPNNNTPPGGVLTLLVGRQEVIYSMLERA